VPKDMQVYNEESTEIRYEPYTAFYHLAACWLQEGSLTPRLWEYDQTLWSSCKDQFEH
jgi:hypothetical protein